MHVFRIRTSPLAVTGLCCLVCSSSLVSAQSLLPPRPVPPQVFQQIWLDEVSPWISASERAELATVEGDAELDRWWRDFWRARDPSPRLLLNEAKEQHRHHRRALELHGLAPTDPRGRLLLLHGPPAAVVGRPCSPSGAQAVEVMSCGVAPPFELFDFGEGAPVADGILFVGNGGGCQLYRGDSTPFRFRRTTAAAHCALRSVELFADRLQRVVEAAVDWPEIEALGLRLPRRAATVPALESAHVARPSLRLLGFEAEREAGGSGGLDRFWVRAELLVPVSLGWRGVGLPWRNLRLRSILFSSGQLLYWTERVVVVHADPGPELGLPWDLLLPRGIYRLVTHVEDETGQLFVTTAFDLEVPSAVASDRIRRSRGVASSDGVREVVDAPWIELPRLSGLELGSLDLELTAWSEQVSTVDYVLDAGEAVTAREPPFAGSVDLGPIPVERVLVATGYDASGRRVAEDSVIVNRGMHRFSVSLDDRSLPERGLLWVEGAVAVPLGRRLERVEVFESEERVASFTTAEFRYQRVGAESDLMGAGTVVVQAVARLDDGSETSATLLLSQGAVEEVDVDLVEVFAAVNERSGRPRLGLRKVDVRLSEDGRPQRIIDFRHLNDLPLNMLLMLDSSSTMREEATAVRAAGHAFLEQVLREGDRAGVVLFNHRTYAAAPFTDDLEVLAEAVDALRPWGGTSLISSAVLSLHYLAGIEGRKALIVLSDGVDQHSRIGYRELIEYAERVDVAVYTIGMGTQGAASGIRAEARKLLRGLAERTGGRDFIVKTSEQLADVFAAIEADLRSQYLLTYQSDAEPSDRDYRTIQVEVPGRGIEVRSRPGYYP